MNQSSLNPIIINPEGETAQYALILMHGLGASANNLSTIPHDLDLPESIKMRFVLPNAPIRAVTLNHGLSMPAWFDVNSLSDLKNEDIKGMHDSQLKIEALIAQQINQGIQKDHIFLGGFSQGAVMALLTGLQYEQPLAGIIALSGYLPVTPTFKTYTSTDQKILPIFLGHGTLDDIVPIALANEALNRLKLLGYRVEYHSYEMAHQISLQEIQDIRQWLIKAVS